MISVYLDSDMEGYDPGHLDGGLGVTGRSTPGLFAISPDAPGPQPLDISLWALPGRPTDQASRIRWVEG